MSDLTASPSNIIPLTNAFNVKYRVSDTTLPYAQYVEQAICAGQPAEMVAGMRKYIGHLLTRNGSDESLFEATARDLFFWSYELKKISGNDTLTVFACAQAGMDAINELSGNSVCDANVINAVCVALNMFAYHAVRQNPKLAPDALGYVERVIKITSAEIESPEFYNTFTEATSVWENILFTSHFSPAERFEVVAKLYEWADESPDMDILKEYLYGLRQGAYVSNGIKILPTPEQEKDLQRWHGAHALASQPQVVSLAAFHVAQLGLSSDMVPIASLIENRIRDRRFHSASTNLHKFFLRSVTRDDELVYGDDAFAPTSAAEYVFWHRKTEELAKADPLLALNLGVRCLNTARQRHVDYGHMLWRACSLTTYAVSRLLNEDGLRKGTLDYNSLSQAMIMVMQITAMAPDRGNWPSLFTNAGQFFLIAIKGQAPEERFHAVEGLHGWVAAYKECPPLMGEFFEFLKIHTRPEYDGVNAPRLIFCEESAQDYPEVTGEDLLPTIRHLRLVGDGVHP